MWLLILRNLRHRRNAFASAFVAMAVAAVVVSACAALAASGARAAVPPHRLAGAPVVVLGDQSFVPPGADRDDPVWLPEKVRLPVSVADTLRGVRGVATVIEDLAFPAELAGAAATGHDWAGAGLVPYPLKSGAAPTGPGQIVLDAGLAARAGLAPGGQAQVEVHGVTERYTVTGLATSHSGRPAARPAIFFSAADARRLAGHPGTADALAVLPAPGVRVADLERRIAAALRGTRAVTLTGDERGLAEFPRGRERAGDLAVVAAAIGAMTLLAMTPVVAGVVGSMAARRRPELLAMRAMGVPRARVRLMMLGEIAVLSAAATLAGSLAGPHLAYWLFERMAAVGAVPAQLVFDPAPLALGAAALSCLAGGLIGACIPAHRAGRARRSEDAARRWSPMAKICLAGAGALSVVVALLVRAPHAGVAGLAVAVLALAGALTLGRLTGVIGRALAGPVRALSARTGDLALLNLRGGRAGRASLPIMLATCLATTNIFLQAGETDAATRAFDEHLRADAVMETATGGIAPAALARIANLPGVSAGGLVTSTAYLAGDGGRSEAGRPAHGVTNPSGLTAFPVSAGSPAELGAHGVALGEEEARRAGAALGDTITVWLGDGTPVRVRVVALLALEPGAEFLLLPAALLAPHTTATLPARVLIRGGPGVDARRAAEESGLHPAGTADSAEHLLRGWVDYLITAVIMVFTAIAVAAAQGSAAARRGREFGVHRAGGATRAQVMRMLGVEALLVAAIGVVLGTVGVVPVLIPYSVVVSGLPLPSGSAWFYLAVVASGTVSALVATLYHAWCTGGREGWLRGRRPGRG
ncbi:FtsX-like permease family protein [Nonomuraea fuscirosea]|uniref:FtsX-like permease family protein n=1 Tax=Nonomuraea fuscirosea TaxID=1291556 RepID=UPI002DDB165A|nr:FtsX-like permease family protein [Nonomuraea fuscirosea]WSA57254.1 FtsX-like permease family protein [Nonomuraea fuscirosea]